MEGRRAWLEVLFRIRPEERATALLLFAQCFCVVSAAFVVGRTLGVTLFLQRVDPAFVPYTYAISALGVSVVALFYARIADRFRRDHIVQGTAVLFAALCLLLRFTLHDSLWFLAVVYVFFDIVGDISLIQLWTLASDVMTARQGKRLFAFVAAGGTLGGALVGVILGSAMHHIGAPNLFLVVAALLLGAALAARRLGALHKLPEPRAERSPKSRKGSAPNQLATTGTRRVLSDRYTLTLAALLVVATLATTLVDYQWKMSARDAYLGDEESLAAYFSYFAVATNGTAILIQLFVTSRLLERFGLGAGLNLLPGGLLAALGGALLTAGSAAFFWATTLAKGVDGAVRYSINEASVLVLYRPIPGQLRGRAKALIGGVFKPLAAGAAGLLIAGVSVVIPFQQLGWLTLPLIALWLLLIAGTRRLYVKRLTAQLSSRVQLEGDTLGLDAHTRDALAHALGTSDRDRILGALALLRTFETLPFPLPLEHLLTVDQEVASRTLELLASHQAATSLAPVEAAMAHADPEVRARAIAVLLRQGDLAHLLQAGDQLRQMVDDPDPAIRAAAATTFALANAPRFHGPLINLLTDDATPVRLAAAHAAAQVPHEALAPHLTPLLNHATTRHAARHALARLGPAAVPSLRQVLTQQGNTQSEPARLAAVRALAEMSRASPEAKDAIGLIEKHLGPCSDAVGRECAKQLALRSCVDSQSDLCVEDRARTRALFDGAVQAAQETARIRRELGEVEPELLGDALRQRWRHSACHALALASALHPHSSFRELERALFRGDSAQKADALELIDNMPLGDLAPLLVALFDPPPVRGSKAPNQRAERLAQLLTHADGWLVSCAVYELAIDGKLHLHLDQLRDHPDPLVRETVASAQSGVMVRRVQGASIRMVSPLTFANSPS